MHIYQEGWRQSTKIEKLLKTIVFLCPRWWAQKKRMWKEAPKNICKMQNMKMISWLSCDGSFHSSRKRRWWKLFTKKVTFLLSFYLIILDIQMMPISVLSVPYISFIHITGWFPFLYIEPRLSVTEVVLRAFYRDSPPHQSQCSHDFPKSKIWKNIPFLPKTFLGVYLKFNI